MKLLNQALAERIMNYITDFQLNEGRSPGIRQMQKDIKVSSCSVIRRYLSYLEGQGLITKTAEGKIEMPDNLDGGGCVRVPILGKVACGEPIEAIENFDGCYSLPERIFGSGDMFMLTAEGESMQDLGISSGDLVVVKRQPTAHNGQVVVAMTEEYGATLKTYFDEGDHIRLHPENSSGEFKDIILENCEVLGVAVKVIKDI